jgi:hypothetical protein
MVDMEGSMERDVVSPGQPALVAIAIIECFDSLELAEEGDFYPAATENTGIPGSSEMINVTLNILRACRSQGLQGHAVARELNKAWHTIMMGHEDLSLYQLGVAKQIKWLPVVVECWDTWMVDSKESLIN